MNIINRTKGMDMWNRLTNVIREVGVGGDWITDSERIS